MKFIYFLSFLMFSVNIQSQILKDCSKCSTNLINIAQIDGLSIDEIRLLTNEIFARNGFQFENGRFQDYFESKNWYHSKSDHKKVILNTTEKENVKFFQSRTIKLETDRKEIVEQIKNFKTLVFAHKITELKNVFNFQYEKSDGDYEVKYLKQVLHKIDLDDINYYKNLGLNAVTVDNGFVQIKYEIAVDGNSVRINYNWMTNSSIIADLDEFTDYHSENEFSYEWQFVYEDKKLKFKRLAVAG